MSKSLNNIEDVFFLSKAHEIEQNIPSINPETYINQINNLNNQTFNVIPSHEEINNNSYKELLAVKEKRTKIILLMKLREKEKKFIVKIVLIIF